MLAAYPDSWTQGELTLALQALALGAHEVGGPLSLAEVALATAAKSAPLLAPSTQEIAAIRDAIGDGLDPLGDALIAARTQPARRLLGQVFTPPTLVAPMVEWTLAQEPTRIVDAGSGSGRFSLALARQTDAQIVAVDNDPLATLLTRAGLAATGHTAFVLNVDYTQGILPAHEGRTAFIGNPPYVRHHSLESGAKAWAQMAAGRVGVPISGLAGLHAYFFVATAIHGKPGDVGCFVTSSEWLDVNYGEVIRRLLLDGLGGRSIHVFEPKSEPFDTAAFTTAAITCFEIASQPKSIRFRMVSDANDLSPLTVGKPVDRARLAEAQRWLPLIRSTPVIPDGYVELGEICRVHRGAVTGANATWIASGFNSVGVPERYLRPSVTRARELISAGERLESTDTLRRVIDLPADLDELEAGERRTVGAFLERAKADGAGDTYTAQSRKAWWSVGLSEPAPILATYMARRVPAFVRNIADARHINIAHGIYPREPLPDRALERLSMALRSSVSVGLGRTYAGGLVKFEPREMERIPVPSLDLLLAP